MKKQKDLWKKMVALLLGILMMLSSVCVNAEVTEQPKISQDLQNAMDEAEEDTLLKIWIFLENPITDEMIDQMLWDEYQIVYPPTSGGSDYIDYCIMAYRTIVKREYSAITDKFVEEHVNPERKISYKGGYTTTLILEATKAEIEAYAKLDSVHDMSLYQEVIVEPFPDDTEELTVEFAATLKEDYKKFLNDSDLRLEDIVFEYYGAYEKCHIVWMHCKGVVDTSDMAYIRVGDYVFTFGSGSASERFYAYVDNTFIPVKTAYIKGLLNDEEVEALAVRYKSAEYQPWNYVDVKTTDWYYPGTRFCVQNGIMVGVDQTHFDPERTITRAEFITALYRLAGKPRFTQKHTFEDVMEYSYYESAVSWGTENKIVYGTSADTFSPDAPITREEIACFVARYVEMIEADFLNDGLIAELSYDDLDQVSEFAKESVDLIRHEALMRGNANGMFYPQNPATRAEVATVFMNLFPKIV